MNLCRFRATVVRRDANQQVLRISLGVFDEHIEISISIEHTRIEQFILQVFA